MATMMKAVLRAWFSGGWVVFLVLGVGYGLSYPGSANPDSYSKGWVPPWSHWPTPLEALAHEMFVIVCLIAGLVVFGLVAVAVLMLCCRLRKWAYNVEEERSCQKGECK